MTHLHCIINSTGIAVKPYNEGHYWGSIYSQKIIQMCPYNTVAGDNMHVYSVTDTQQCKQFLSLC